MKFTKDTLEWLEFDVLKEFTHLKHASFYRNGGVSAHPFDSLNLSDAVGDSPDAVQTNIDIVKNQFQLGSIVFSNNQHQTKISLVTPDNKHKVFHCDGLMTNHKNIALAVNHADCQAAIFFDPKNDAIAIAHAGWKGVAKNIYSNVISEMKATFKSNPSDIIVAIAPSICVEHCLINNPKIPPSLLQYRNEKNYFDLKKMASDQLAQLMIKPSNIEISDICTFNDTRLFSAKRDKKTGRGATFVALV